MAKVVIDSSAALEWLLDPGVLQQSEVILIEEASFVAPPLWRLEVVNALLAREKRRLVNTAEASAYLDSLIALKVTIRSPPLESSPHGLAALARKHQLTSYDAVFLALAKHAKLPLYTRDKNMQAAARRAGVKLILG